MPQQPRRPPTSRLSRSARLGGLVAGQSARWVGTRAANVVRSPERADAATGERDRGARARARRAARADARGGDEGRPGALDDRLHRAARGRARAVQADARGAPRRRPAAAVQAASRSCCARSWASGRRPSSRSSRRRPSPPRRSGRSTARSRTTGNEVAVKVQYPGVAEAVDTDLRNLTLLLPLVKRLAPGLDVKALYGELRERIAEELDYELEAQNQRAVARAHRGHPFAHVPEVHTELSSRRVLVTDLLEGERFEAVKAPRRGDPRPLRRDRVPLLLRPRPPHAARVGRPAPRQLPAARRRPRRLPRLRAHAGDRARLPRPRGAMWRSPSRRATPRPSTRAGRAGLPAGARRRSSPTTCSRSSQRWARGTWSRASGGFTPAYVAELIDSTDRPALAVVRADAAPVAAAAGAAAAPHGGARALHARRGARARRLACDRARVLRRRGAPRRRSARPSAEFWSDLQAAA